LIYGPGPKVIAFVLNAQINSVKTPDMMKLWGYTPTSQCHLCEHKQCTLHHILVNCPFALEQGRYNWRHDSVLFNIEVGLQKFISEVNKRKLLSNSNALKQNFVRAGQKTPLPRARSQSKEGLLTRANDWNLLVDYDHKKVVFPPNICSTSERPDIVIWSRMSRNVILLELTCCAEEGVKAAQMRKQVRYHELIENINASKWNASLLTIEVGARGLVGSGTFRAFVKLGLPSQTATSLCQTLSIVVARCSYAICLAQDSAAWSHNTDLVVAHPLTDNTPSEETKAQEN
jgi:hypothetical protein